ncbi:MAG TPA: GNAT family N-acetyltransferase [Meiothermus sp.]|jgi:RimJ/RimL family protein N-acetyltransferase|nr:GNAT family N-acetyltransferase [Meiothermus sp.]
MITTDRLILRDFRLSDCLAVHEFCSDPEVMRFMLAGEP